MPDSTPKQVIVRVCNEPPCAEKGAGGIMKKIEQTLGMIFGTKNENYDLDTCPCLGSCEFGPNLLVNNNLVTRASKDTVMAEINRAADTTALTMEEKQANLDKVLNEGILGDLI